MQTDNLTLKFDIVLPCLSSMLYPATLDPTARNVELYSKFKRREPSVHSLIHQTLHKLRMHSTADTEVWVWGGWVTLGSAEDQVEHAVCSITTVEAHHHLAAPGHAICLPASIMRSLIPPTNRLFIKSLCMQRQQSFCFWSCCQSACMHSINLIIHISFFSRLYHV